MEPPGLTQSPSVSVVPSVTPSLSPSPTGIVESSDPELGIVFDDVPDLSGDEAQVYNWVAVYEKEYWRTLTTNEVSPEMSVLASAEVQSSLASLVQTNVEDGSVIEGEFRVRISDVAVTGNSPTASVCRDLSAVTVTEGGRVLSPEETGMAEPSLRTPTLARSADGTNWTVQRIAASGTC